MPSTLADSKHQVMAAARGLAARSLAVMRFLAVFFFKIKFLARSLPGLAVFFFQIVKSVSISLGFVKCNHTH